jgi:hypothetical protein
LRKLGGAGRGAGADAGHGRFPSVRLEAYGDHVRAAFSSPLSKKSILREAREISGIVNPRTDFACIFSQYAQCWEAVGIPAR